jgi:hypothetical protein
MKWCNKCLLLFVFSWNGIKIISLINALYVPVYSIMYVWFFVLVVASLRLYVLFYLFFFYNMHLCTLQFFTVTGQSSVAVSLSSWSAVCQHFFYITVLYLLYVNFHVVTFIVVWLGDIHWYFLHVNKTLTVTSFCGILWHGDWHFNFIFFYCFFFSHTSITLSYHYVTLFCGPLW